MKKKILIITLLIAVILVSLVSCSSIAKIMSRTNTVNYQIDVSNLEDASIAEVVASNTVESCARIISTFKSGSLEESVSGAGFVITSDGYMITNRHCVVLYVNLAHNKSSLEKTTECYIPVEPLEIKIVFADSVIHKADLVYYIDDATELDLAILKIKGEDATFQPISIDASSDLYYGQSIFTFGNPEGIGLLFCTANVATPSLKMSSSSEYESIIIDGNINHGNSGGVLLDAKSHCVGVVYARVEMGKTSATYGLGCAIKASDMVTFIKGCPDAAKINITEIKPAS